MRYTASDRDRERERKRRFTAEDAVCKVDTIAVTVYAKILY